MSNPYKKHKIDDRILTHVESWTVGKSKENQTPYIRVKLSGGISWTGWIKSPKSIEITLNALQTMGFKGSNLAMIKEENALDTNRDIIAVIGEIRLHEGRTYYDAKFINRAPKLGFSQAKDSDGVMGDLEKVDTRSVIEDATDISTPAVSDASLSSDGFDASFAADDIPF